MANPYRARSVAMSKPLAAFLLLILSLNLSAESTSTASLCDDPELFWQQGWEHQAVQDAMDLYLRDHRMRANWLNQPAPPDQIGKDYYQWLWHNSFGAAMKREIVQQYCGNYLPENKQ